MSQPPQDSELSRLTNLALEGKLDPDDTLALRKLLKASAGARRSFRQHCRLHALLLTDAEEELASLDEDKVVSMGAPLGSPIGKRQKNTGKLIVALAALAAVITAAAVLLPPRLSSTTDAPLTSVAEPVTAPQVKLDPAPTRPTASPEERYQELLAINHAGGSQNRPPQKTIRVDVSTPVHADAPSEVSFNRHVRPILSEHCFSCHGPDAESREADLRLDTEDGAKADLGGYAAIVPGDPQSSLLLDRITTKDPDDIMPPAEIHTRMTPEQILTVRLWIEQGAKWEAHWAFLKPERPVDPDATIDSLVQNQLRSTGLQSSPEAHPETLIRRASLDLTGLPPELEEVREFERAYQNDPEAAYTRLIDNLLTSERFGEHRARYWLDAARYADTHGFHLDNYRSIWPYRDWVINAFNDNKPFDEFTIEQLAGDLLPGATLEQRIATGFNRCNPTTSEGGIIDEEYEAIYATDRVETTMTVWAGLTAGCAACHDHKFDPITQEDFYQLTAFFRNTTMPTRDGNKPNHPPNMVVPSEEDRPRWNELDQHIPRTKRELATLRKLHEPDFQSWREASAADTNSFANLPEPSTEKLLLHAPLIHDDGSDSFSKIEANGERTGPLGQASIIASANPCDKDRRDDASFDFQDPASYGAWVYVPKASPNGALFSKMNAQSSYIGWDLWVDPDRIGVHLIHQWPSNAIRVFTPNGSLKRDQWHHVFVTYDGSAKAKGIRVYIDGTAQKLSASHDTLNASIRHDSPLQLATRVGGNPTIDISLQDLRIYGRNLGPAEVSALADSDQIQRLLSKPTTEHTPAQTDTLRDHFFSSTFQPTLTLLEQLAGLTRERNQITGRSPITLIMQEKADSKPIAHILDRGEYDQKKEQVSADVPGFLPPLDDDSEANRLGLAQWLVSPDNPLTARVTVNRFWQELFGTALVKTSEDFGIMGEPPSHPTLLDWLAIEFVESGWDVKHIFRTMLLSKTYRQSSRIRPGDLETDAENRLLARGPRFRLDAETIRDQALFLSGLLRPDIGGASVKPPQPGGLWKTVAYPSSDTANFKQDTGDAIYRRSLYTFWKRTSAPPPMSIFDAPDRESCVVRRERTNTPLQALVLMNEPQFVESARLLATRLLHKTELNSDRDRLAYLFAQVTSRDADDRILDILDRSRASFADAYSDNLDAATALLQTGDSQTDESLPAQKLATWTMVASQLLNLDEVINKN